jgi:hypothetical protein
VVRSRIEGWDGLEDSVLEDLIGALQARDHATVEASMFMREIANELDRRRISHITF